MTKKATVCTLLERFNDAEKKISHSGSEFYPERNVMEFELGHLLSREMKRGIRCVSQADMDMLQEFREYFEWDTTYGVSVTWEIQTSTASQYIECSCAEDVAAYLSGAKEPDCPDYDDIHDDIDYGCDLTGDFWTNASISVSNLRPKQKKEINKYLVNLILECDGEVASLENYLNSFFNQSTVIKHAQVCSVTADA